MKISTRQRKAVIQGIEAEDNDLLRSFAQRYRMPASLIDKQGWTDELLRRVAPIPVSIALAQAAIESGWGQSRFALKETPFLVSGSGMTNWA